MKNAVTQVVTARHFLDVDVDLFFIVMKIKLLYSGRTQVLYKAHVLYCALF